MPFLRLPHKFIDGVEHKKCYSCKENLKLTLFNRSGRYWDKLDNICKVCESERKKKYYKKPGVKELKNKTRQIWRKKNPERVHRSDKRNRQKRKLNGKHRAYRNKRYRNDDHFRLRIILASRLTKALKSNGVQKTTSTMKLCGCSLDKLQQHLESQFTDGMSWENKGEWHIDHIKPCAAFDLTDVEEQKKCFHFTNLQPLWALDNIRKGAKY